MQAKFIEPIDSYVIGDMGYLSPNSQGFTAKDRLNSYRR
jgi:hypothetical protein